MIHPFEFYVTKNMVRKTTINPAIAKSLLEKSKIRIKRISREKISEKESSIVFEDVYEAMREACQSIMQLKGYKPYSHEALIAFLKEENVLALPLINDLNRYRILRNKSVYEAKKVSVETCQEALAFAKKLLDGITKK